MIICYTVSELSQQLNEIRLSGKQVGFVPTMGALHQGHLSLVKQCLDNGDFCVVSIFVNPIQFNDPRDYEKYPRVPEKDLDLLKEIGCHLVFLPSEYEVYPQPDTRVFDLGFLETVMEGKFRPGHFQGVARVVDRLFEMVKPNNAYFGLKDYQQFMVISRLIVLTQRPIKLFPCATLREHDGLAMSSRNARLSIDQRKGAGNIYQTLSQIPTLAQTKTIAEIEAWVENKINNTPFMRLEYIQFANPQTLQPLLEFPKSDKIGVFIAVFCGEVRLIDNLFFYL